MIKLDLKHFKHKESGKNSTTLEHKDGHLFTLAHGKLSKEHRAQLEALRDATKAKNTLEKSPKIDSESSSEHKSKEHKAQLEALRDSTKTKSQLKDKEPVKMASGGKVPYKLEEETPVTEQSLVPEESDLGAVSEKQTTKDTSADFLPSKVLAPPMKDYVPKDDPGMPEAPKPSEFVSQKAGQQGLNEYARLDEPQRQEYLKKIGYDQPQAAAPEAMQQPMQPSSTPAEQPEQSQPVSPQQAPQQASQVPIQKPAVPQQTAPQPPKPSDDYMRQVQDVQHDFANGHITPKTYSSMFAEKSTLGKIGTIFGLLTSGIGSGLSGQPNMLMDMMDKEIQQDLDAQKSSKSNQMNFMQLAEQHVMNEANITHLRAEDHMKARALAQQYAYMSTYDKLAKQAQSMPEGPAKVSALNALGGIAKGIQDKALMTGSMLDTQYEAMKRNPNLGTATAGQEEVDKTYAEKEYVPFTSKGATTAKTSIGKMKLLASELKKDSGFGEAGGTRLHRLIPEELRSTDAIRRKTQAVNLANSTLKELFGGQLSDDERRAAASEYYNDALDNKANAKLLEGKIAELEATYHNKVKQAEHYEKNGTLRGFKGSEAKGADTGTVMKNGVQYKFDPDRNGYIKVK